MAKSVLSRGLFSFSSMTMISRVLGLVREQVMYASFGVNAMTDAFWVAFRIPNFMRRLFAEGSFSTAFVPVLTEVKEQQSHAELKELISRVSGTLGGILLIVTALGVLLAPQLTMLFSPGALNEPEKFQATVDLLRLTLPFLLFVSLTALCGGALNAFNKFGLPALAPVILNICIIVAALWFSNVTNPPILILGWAVLIAGILQLLFLLPAMQRLDLLALPKWGWNHLGVKKIMKLMVPTLFGSSVAQVNMLISTVIASYLYTGSQTWLTQADRFLELPLGVFGVALGTVILPALSRHHIKTDHEGFSSALDWGLRTTLLIALPAMLGLMLLAEPLVATLFQHGKFTAFDTRMATLSVVGMSFGLPAFALIKVLLPAFYSRQNTKTPVRAGIAALIANMLLNFMLLTLLYSLMVKPEVRQQGVMYALANTPGLHLALGIASALSSYVNLWLLWHWLKREGVYQPRVGWKHYVFRTAAACIAMSLVLLAGLYWMPDFTQATVLVRILNLSILVCAGMAIYAAVQFALGFRLRDLRGH